MWIEMQEQFSASIELSCAVSNLMGQGLAKLWKTEDASLNDGL
jgi:hypothetical protein